MSEDNIRDTEKMRICILSESGRDLIINKGSLVGGGEVQMTTLAKELAKKSHDIFFITFKKTKNFFEISDSVNIYNVFNASFKGYSFLFPTKIYKLIKLLNKIDADIYIKKGYTPLTGIIAFIAKLQKKKFLFIVSSEKEVSEYLKKSIITYFRQFFFRFGILHSDKVICQTNHQKVLLSQHSNKDGLVIKNMLKFHDIYDLKRNSRLMKKILWVGKFTSGKRPELFLNLAKRLPDYKFCMIMKNMLYTSLKHYNEIKNKAIMIKNLDFIDYVPHKEINKYYKKSSILVSTSMSEGFPNTFLEAWSNSIPVVSFGFDPDEIICKKGLGVHVENFEDLIKYVDVLINNDKLREKMGKLGRKYVENEHNINNIVNQYEKIINEIILIKK